MITRQLLIIHESRVIRNLLKGYVLAELDDVTPLEATSGEEAERIVNKERIDIILCAAYLKDGEGFELQSKLHASERGATIPFIVFTSTAAVEHISELKSRGVKHYLVTPFTSTELRTLIDEVFDPRRLRQQARYNIPGSQAIVHFENQNIVADIINLSVSSAFCEFVLPAGRAELLESIYISIRFPPEFDDVLISDIYCKLLSIKTISWHANDAPDVIRVVWLFKNLSQRNKAMFSNVLDKVEEKNKRLAHI